MSTKRKLRRVSRVSTSKREPPVLIVRPHKQEGVTCEATSQFLSKAFRRGIADYMCLASTTPDIARNKGIEVFLHDKFHKKQTHLFFLDDDSTPMEDYVIERLMSLDKPVVAGVTPIMRKKEGIDFKKIHLLGQGIVRNEHIKNVLYWSPIVKNDKGELENIGVDELPGSLFVAHRTGGTGLMLRRDVLEKLKPPYQKFEFDEKQINLLRSEDVYFSDKLREAGFDIWIDPKSICHHFHTLDILDMFQIAIEARQMGYDEAMKDYKILK